MTRLNRRANAELMRWVRAAAFGGMTAWALSALAFKPESMVYVIAFLTGALALFAPGVSILATIIAVAIPIMASNLLVGAVFLIAGFASVQFLAEGRGRAYLFLMTAFIGAALGPAWAAAVVAGYVLGASEGAVVAVLACLALEAVGIAGGLPGIGVIATGGSAPLVSLAKAPDNLLTFSWFGAALDTIRPGDVVTALTSAEHKLLLAVQPVIWGIAAVIGGTLRRPAEDQHRQLFAFVAPAVGVVSLSLGSVIAIKALGGPALSASAIAVATTTSLAAALIATGLWELVFPPVHAPAPALAGMSAEEADVDELLRMIASAEDQLASRHMSRGVVMITDMKSFSRMTEEDGSILSAKAIQRHRDLLLPVVSASGGQGKSTGGDGLVAAFPTADKAVSAAVSMQKTLRANNDQHPVEREIIIRIGIAAGEVVLDKGGRPFIGTALNLAARIMNLADGGQIYATRDVADGGSPRTTGTVSHGEFELKNIADRTEVVELLWFSGQRPAAPGSRSD